MRMKTLLAVGLWAGALMGQVAGSETEAILKQLRELETTEAGQEEKRLNEEQRNDFELRNKKSQEISAKIEEWRKTPAAKELMAKREELNKRRNARWEEDRQRIAAAAKKLYQERHEELKPLAAGELVEAKKLGLDVLAYPRVDGSTSTHPLSIVIAARVLGAGYGWTYPEPQGSPWGRGPVYDPGLYLPTANVNWVMEHNREAEFTLASARMAAKPRGPQEERLARMINTYLATSANTHQAYLRLAGGECDLNLTVRGPSEDELKAAKEKGVEFELVPVAKDALVFMVHSENSIKSLTRDQLRAMFSRELKAWSEVGSTPPSNEINAYWRERNSGSRELFDALIGAKAPAENEIALSPVTRHGIYAESMVGPYNRLLADRGGIAYSVWYYDRYMAMSPQTRTIAVEGVEPTRQNIATGKYALVTTVYAVHRKGESADSPTMKLISWLRSEEGQRVVRESGYVER